LKNTARRNVKCNQKGDSIITAAGQLPSCVDVMACAKIDNRRSIMDNNDRNDRYVVGHTPVNRRTADPQWLKEAPEPPHLLERARQLRQRHELGAPLADLLDGTEFGAAHPPVPGVAVAGLIAGTALLPLAGLSGSLLFGGVLGTVSLVLLGFAGWRIAAARRGDTSAQLMAGRAPLINAQALSALDKVLDEVALELDEALMQQLLQLKHALARVIELERSPDANGRFSSEDQLYLQQCIKRYLPDSLLAYLNVPAQHRHQVLAEPETTPAQALSSQLALILQTLERHETRGVAAASEALMRQQRFLQAKTRGPS
jgi:hypothetical protein